MQVQESQLKRWMIDAQNGDKSAYHLLLTNLESVFRRFCFSLGVSSIDIDDVVQNTLIAIHTSRHTYLPERSFFSWAFGICRKKIHDQFRIIHRQNNREISDDALLFTIFSKEIETDDQTDPYEMALSALNDLPELQKAVVTAIKVEKRPIKDVAKSLNMSEAAVKTTAHRGYKKLKELFNKIVLKGES